MADEVQGQGLRQLGIGHAYEALWWTGESFEYIDDILYLTLRVGFDNRGEVQQVERLEPFFKYFARDELSVVATLRRESEQRFNVITPVGPRDKAAVDALVAEVGGPDWTVPLRSRFYGAFLDLRAPGYVGPLLAFVMEDAVQPDPPIFTEPEPGVLRIALSGNLFTWMYQAIRGDQARHA